MSILHFDKQSIKRQTLFSEHPEEFICQEKIDGTFIQVQCDSGIITLFRNKEPMSQPSDWGMHFWTTAYREAHQAVDQIAPELKATFGEDFVLMCEILSVNNPNTIPYDRNINRLVIFAPDDILFQAKTTVTDFEYLVTTDGLTTSIEKRTGEWEVLSLPEIPKAEWEDVVKTTPAENFYETLLDKLVKPRASMFGSNAIEGLVFRHATGWQFKLVIRDQFTAMNNRNQAFRRPLFRSGFARDQTIMDKFPLVGPETTLAAINAHFAAYMQDPDNDALDDWVRQRNLEAVQSLRLQMQELINGR